ncbi:VPLPA-CTERM sorting domain-containing protein [Octadecabacter sp. 1_MG-2023]|uniref:VPLPA-CTERM sorting domain-containing protein n=1 Tax=unclassified Octadecabacter TaxID=196158 RepID=UPI001C09F1D4|nr:MULTISPECIES: VPLPA-CTERM sorting domain-containing protein [unclassified Octadecabacter]MBU2991609.1 VPLPA-CTERM sorting domain-containing protein [Octadecabacter sp. B2R22]MDO6736136.1 VPLPA-CTERM sorting domain-containing protein [Octadecabacter sp. 1_MG-2023]
MTLKYLAGAAAAMILSTSAAQAVPMLSFVIDGNTYSDPFAITNTSDAGESIVAFGINLSGATAGDYCFDTVNYSPCNDSLAVPFTPISGATVSSSSTYDGSKMLDIIFSSFSSGSTFLFDIDVDNDAGSATVYGNELIGATAYADFSDGQRLLGVFAAVSGNADASAFTSTGLIPTPAVPLPAGFPLILAGLGALGFMKRRKNLNA